MSQHTVLIELDATTQVFLADVLDEMDREKRIPVGKAMAWANLRQQIATANDAQEAMQKIRTEAAQAAISAMVSQPKPILPPNTNATPLQP